jgi:PAS domain-containing protein
MSSTWLDHTDDAIVWRPLGASRSGMRARDGCSTKTAGIGPPATLSGLPESDGERMDRRRNLAQHDRWRGEMRVEREDGTEVPVDARAVVIRAAEARIIGYLGIVRGHHCA